MQVFIVINSGGEGHTPIEESYRKTLRIIGFKVLNKIGYPVDT
jgi:hypothetical protein